MNAYQDFNAGYLPTNVDTVDAEKKQKTAMFFVLAVVSSLFFLMIIAFMVRSQYEDWEHLSAPWQPLSNPMQLWANTLLLCLASIALETSKRTLNNVSQRMSKDSFIFAGICALGFICGQLWLWTQLYAINISVNVNPSYSFFYLLTAAHVMHIFAGVILWLVTLLKLRSCTSNAQQRHMISLCARYWHYLLAIWGVILILLTLSPQNFEAFAAICGLR